MRKKKSWSWVIVSSLAVLSAAVLGTGFGLAVFGPNGQSAASMPVQADQPAKPATAVQQQDQSKPFLMVALGDSLTKGVGDKNGKGYVGYLQDKLEAAGTKVGLQNLGISGLTSPELVKSIRNAGIQSLIHDAKLVTISIGANDLTHSVGDIGKALDTKQLDENKIRQAQVEYTKNLVEILKTVRSSNQSAPVLVVGLYNPFEGMFDDKGTLDKLLLEWNSNVVQTVQQFPNVKVVPTFDIFEWNDDRYLYLDHFHPNEEGYQRMADRMAQALPASMLAKKQ